MLYFILFCEHKKGIRDLFNGNAFDVVPHSIFYHEIETIEETLELFHRNLAVILLKGITKYYSHIHAYI